MTPFGRRIRELRRDRGVTMKDMAAALRVTPAYLSALEHGKRGRPSWRLVQAIIGYFNVIWDEAEELERLARISHPRIVIDTAGLAPQATELANRLAEEIAHMAPAEIASLLALLEARERRDKGRTKK
ncbi:transcriptional regulator, XRE family [Parvibaculum lavamentivorans DS-1]|uniref:Transcriptional regulator, XRE family n=1 Tax=Parvibaculum lavamentivorans (strain DS-1 / DSM 13023 / NCIMB 13966) TaxID=402881 RepID=A7HSI2_PARL1|nr:helix-turn-helix domain-containing protein [Parvibaculum lavamentivorans]ABS62865.1 transcriptional regulator, XRE family [Parvibaculum lavamentivorans DS-1]